MLNIETVDNFRTFETDKDGRELHMTDIVCDACVKPSEVYIKIGGDFAVDNGCDFNEIYLCKTCISKCEQLWNEAFLVHARRDRVEQEKFLKGE